jgi:hypothetical protein
MNSPDLARLKIERAIALSEDYDGLDEGRLKQLLLSLRNGLYVLPNKNKEWGYLYNITSKLLDMKLEKMGYVFKASSWKESLLVNKQDVTELVWRAHSLLY